MESSLVLNVKMVANYDSINSRVDEILNFNILNKSKRVRVSFTSHTHKKPKNIEKDFDWYFLDNPKNSSLSIFDKILESNKLPNWIVFTNEMYAIDCDKTLSLLDAYFDSNNAICVCSEAVWNNGSIDALSYESIIKKFMPKNMHKRQSSWSGSTYMNSHPSGSFVVSSTALLKIIKSEHWSHWKKELKQIGNINENIVIGFLMTFMKIPMPNIKFMSESFNLSEFTYMKQNGKCSMIKVDDSQSKNYSVYKSSLSNSKRVEPIAAIDSASRMIRQDDVNIKIKIADKEGLSGIMILKNDKKVIFTERKDWNFSWQMNSPGNIILKNIDDKEVGEIKYATNKKNCHVIIKEGRYPITTFGTIYE